MRVPKWLVAITTFSQPVPPSTSGWNFAPNAHSMRSCTNRCHRSSIHLRPCHLSPLRRWPYLDPGTLPLFHWYKFKFMCVEI